jgi:ketol-acid reductoisomerase
MTRGPQIIDSATKQRMKTMLRAIQTGEFAKDWILENQAGRPTLNAYRQEHQELLLEKVGRELRDMMPWLKKKG